MPKNRIPFIEPVSLLRESGVLKLVPISHTCLWQWVNARRFPKPFKLGPKTTVWRASEVLEFIQRAGSSTGSESEQA
jgi:predicted DNA-binding transcriptional regulator AlpA